MSTIDIDSLAGQLTNEEPKKQEPEKQCIFCAIAARTTPAKIVADNDSFVAFLDIQPKAVGHTVIVPKRHMMTFDMMSDEEQKSYDALLKNIIAKQKSRLGATGYTIISSNGGSSGQTVPHFSAHVIPTYSRSQVELPLMNIIQPQKVPDFVMADVVRKMNS